MAYMLKNDCVHGLWKHTELEIKDSIRNQLIVLETDVVKEIETSRSAIARVEKYSETRKEVDRKLDFQHQRKLAEALDTHLTAIQREHEIKWQIEERKIRSEEVARRSGRAHQEEAHVEAEMFAKIRAEEAKKEVERKAAKEEAEKEEADRKAAEQKLTEEKAVIEKLSVAGSSATKIAQAGGKSIQAAESALTLEKHRLKKLDELEAMNQSLKSLSSEDFMSFEKHIVRVIRQIRWPKNHVSGKINEIVKILKDPSCPVSVSIATFANKMVSSKVNPFARSYVIVHVTSQFPQAMDILLAEFHGACIYTVPKHNVNSQSAWDSKAYERLGYVMRLYGALVQTEIRDGNATNINIHGIEHGWAWLARFLNTSSATNDKVTATALMAFLETAGFGLHQRYKSQFVKVMNVVREHFLPRLRAEKDKLDLQRIILDLTVYLDDQKYLEEPEGRSMEVGHLLFMEQTAALFQPTNTQNHQRFIIIG